MITSMSCYTHTTADLPEGSRKWSPKPTSLLRRIHDVHGRSSRLFLIDLSSSLGFDRDSPNVTQQWYQHHIQTWERACCRFDATRTLPPRRCSRCRGETRCQCTTRCNGWSLSRLSDDPGMVFVYLVRYFTTNSLVRSRPYNYNPILMIDSGLHNNVLATFFRDITMSRKISKRNECFGCHIFGSASFASKFYL